MARILIDTGAIYAFVTRTDAHHAQARKFVQQTLAAHDLFVLSDIVFVEAMTLLKARLGAAVAIRVGRELRQNPAYQWVALGADGERDTWAAFQRYDDKEWSYTDCAMLVLSQHLKVSTVFAFDDHIRQMAGIVRVP